jgi:opacity protein-like surface antigen
VLVVLALGVPAVLGPGASASWGPRVGVADDPDQVLVGVHWNAGNLARRVVLQPNAKLGFGSDVVAFLITVPAHYRFATSTNITPYAGGGVTAGILDYDGNHDNDSNFEIGIDAIGGLEWRIGAGRRFALELALGFGDLHDIQLYAGWTFP